MTFIEFSKWVVMVPLSFLGLYAAFRLIFFAYFKSRRDYIVGIIKIREKFFDEILNHEILGGKKDGEEI